MKYDLLVIVLYFCVVKVIKKKSHLKKRFPNDPSKDFYLYCFWRLENTQNSHNICVGGDSWEKTGRWFSKCRRPALLNGVSKKSVLRDGRFDST